MILIDTSVLVALFRDRAGTVAPALRKLLDGRDYYLTRFSQMELLQGALNEAEWQKLSDYLAGQGYLEMSGETWASAARIYYEFRRQHMPLRSVINCCICEIATAHEVTLIHDDEDFTQLAKVRPLKQIRFLVQAPMTLHEEPRHTWPPAE